MKRYVFKFHYNKPASLKAGRPKLTVHFKGKCMIVDEIACYSSCWTSIRKRQPRCVMTGLTAKVGLFTTDDGIKRAVISGA